MLYALVLTETQELVTAETIKQACFNYSGMRAPKRVYTTLANARNGFAHLPDVLQEHVSIAELHAGNLIDGPQLKSEFLARKAKRPS